MPKKTLPLTDAEIRNAKPKGKSYKLADGGGLYLEVLSTGGKSWRLKYRFGGIERRLVFGLWPDVPLKQARQYRDEARTLLAQGIDPGAQRKAEKAEVRLDADTFKTLALDWFTLNKPSWTPRHAAKILQRLERELFPFIGHLPVRSITAQEVRDCVTRVQSRNATDVARRVLWLAGQVLRYAEAHGRGGRDVTPALSGILPPLKVSHHPSLTDPRDVAELLRAIDKYQSFTTQAALSLLAYTFVRPGELRQAEWSEFDLKAAEWRIPAEKMKMRETHLVPLARQAVAILESIKPLTGHGQYVFPSEGGKGKFMSENTLNAALGRMGYKGRMTSHGFRSMASTLLNERGWHRDAVERQLAHAERNSVRAAYNYAEHLPERRKMMQAWADYLDALKAGAKVTPIFREGNG